MNGHDDYGMCAAYPCPLCGSLGSNGIWFCFCHHNRQAHENDAITSALKQHRAIVDATLSIRHHGCTFCHDVQAYRAIKADLTAAGRADLLPGTVDESPHRPGHASVRLWLARLERELIRLTSGIGRQRGPSGIARTAAMPMPKRAPAFHPYGDGADDP
ncbi:hypothetical protein [Paraburkholderia ferrariae]|uniref:Uncharacterized protein n=1 Tax=Paraburkholderia ferrariae TaxID=386056 RepID=A0ABU9RYE5_9BURK